jgi:hypothetical protein
MQTRPNLPFLVLALVWTGTPSVTSWHHLVRARAPPLRSGARGQLGSNSLRLNRHHSPDHGEPWMLSCHLNRLVRTLGHRNRSVVARFRSPPRTTFSSAPCSFFLLLVVARWPGGGHRPSRCAKGIPSWPASPLNTGHGHVGEHGGAKDRLVAKVRFSRVLSAKLGSVGIVSCCVAWLSKSVSPFLQRRERARAFLP